MKRIGNIYEKIIDLNNIELAIAKASIGKGHRKSVEKILDSSTYYSLQVQQLLKEKKYNPSPYIEMKIRDGANRKERTIFKPHFCLYCIVSFLGLGLIFFPLKFIINLSQIIEVYKLLYLLFILFYDRFALENF